jgi:hypothetical protein
MHRGRSVGIGVAERVPSTHSSRVVPERATPMMKMGVGPANALDDSGGADDHADR